MMRTSALLLPCLALLLTATPAGSEVEVEPFPRPAELERDVQFWLRIYSKVGTDAGLIHDNRRLDVVYETLEFPDGVSSRTRSHIVKKTKRGYREALHALARGRRTGLSRIEARVLAAWGTDVSNAELKDAASRLRFQLGQADKFRAGLVRSGVWRRHIVETLSEMGLPVELVALPHVESSFTPHAYSRVGAAGLWQFTRSTGRRYMRVDHVVDERMDPLIASLAAARLLEHNYRATGSWPLALTAYNHGTAGMRRAARKMGTRDIAVIARNYRSRTFGFASRNFYAEFLAALEIDRDPERFFGPIGFQDPVETEVVVLPYYASASGLAQGLGVSLETLKRSNPALRAPVWSGSKRVPKGYPLRLPRAHLADPLETLIAKVPESARYASQTRDTFHRVSHGETLSAIASRYRTSVSGLVALNGLQSQHRIRAGQKIRLPDEGGVGSRRASATPVARHSPPADGSYSVRAGDSLARIAQRFGISEQDLLAWNSIPNRDRIHVGLRLRVSAPGEGLATPVPTAPPAPAHPEQIAEFTPPETSPAEFGITTDTADTTSVADAAAAEREAAGEPADALLADPGDYSVSADGTIEVQAAETLGHYAEWLDVRASRLRELNHMRYGTPLALGQRVRLDLGRVTPQIFEMRRNEHHRSLQGGFFQRYAIDGTSTHRVQRGDSVWQLAEREYDVPLWLLRQYNPDVDFNELHPGIQLTIPKVRLR